MKSSVISLSRINYKNGFYLLCYYFISIVLFFSGIMKILDPLPLIETLKSLQIFPEDLLIVLATLLPIIEIILGGMLILNANAKVALLFTAILFGVFLVVAIYGYIIGLSNDCGCFGRLYESSFGLSMIFRNFVFLNLAVMLIKTDPASINFKRR